MTINNVSTSRVERKRQERLDAKEKTMKRVKVASITAGAVSGAAIVAINVAAVFANMPNKEDAKQSNTPKNTQVMKADNPFDNAKVKDTKVKNTKVKDTKVENTQADKTLADDSNELATSTMMEVTIKEDIDTADPFESLIDELHGESIIESSVEVDSTATNEDVTKVETQDSNENSSAEGTADETVTTTDKVTVDNTANGSQEEISTEVTEEKHEEDKKDHASGVCSKENDKDHNIYTCIEGLELVEGDIDRLTRTVIATTIDGNEAMTIMKGQGVVPGESRGNEQMSILATNAHKAEVQLVVREDALEALQKEHDSDCTHCIPDGDVGKFGVLYARAPRGAYFYKNACNDLGAVPLYEGQLIQVSSGSDRENGKLKASLDGGSSWGYVDSLGLELDVRNSELHKLTTDQAVKRETTKEIVVNGYAFDSHKSMTISAATEVEVYEKTANGSDVAIGYADNIWLVSITEAISAGLLK